MSENVNFDEIWEEAIETYHATTKRTIPEREVFGRICDPEDLRKYLQDHQSQFKSFTSSDEKILNGVNAAIRPFMRLSERTSTSHAASPLYLASPIIGATCFMFQAAGDIAQSYKWIEELFGKLEGYADRLDEYIKGEVSPALKKNIVKVFACFLKILACSEMIMKTKKLKKYTKALFLGQDENITKAFDELDRLFAEEHGLVNAIVLATSQQIKEDGQKILLSSEAAQMEMQTKQLREDIIQWSSSTNFAAKYYDYLEKRQQDTGTWFLEDPKFKDWVEGQGNSTLFCYGSPGAGKTIMATTVIDHLERTRKSSTTPVTYIYCSYTDGISQTPSTLISAVLQQLLQSRESVPPAVLEVYEDKKEGRPLYQDMMDMMKGMVQENEVFYLVIDALDEAMDKHETYAKLLNAVEELQEEANMRVFITSRSIPEITERFEPESMLEIRASREDLQEYLDHVSWRAWIRRDENLITQIKNGVVDAADGMFLLACLYVQWLQGLTRRKEIIKSLQVISHDSRESSEFDRVYDQAYALTILRIEGQSPEQIKLAKQAISWITYAQRQLSITELCSALAIELETDDLDEDNIPSIEEIISVCMGLVVIDKHGENVRLVHYTTQEYLERTRCKCIPEAESEIASMCLTYLAYDAFRDGGYTVGRDIDARIQNYPLLPYLAQNWAIHVLMAEGQMLHLALRFLQCDGSVNAVAQVAEKASPDGKVAMNTTALHLTSRFGLYLLSRELLSSRTESNEDDEETHIPQLNAKDDRRRTPLMLAARHGHLAIVKLLLNAGADVNVQGGPNDNALLCALQGNHREVVDVLLNHNANIHAGHYMANSALATATNHGSPALLARLLDMGTGDLNLDYALYLAAERGNLEMVQLLLVRGAGLEHDGAGPGATPLMIASLHNHEAIVKVLIKKGAKFYVNDGRSALTAATIGGHLHIVRLLLQSGAPVNVHGGKGYIRPAIAEACVHGRKEILQLLLQHGQGVNHHTSPPLVYASMHGNIEIARMLLVKNAEVNAFEPASGWNALMAAASSGHLELVELLLNHGADINLQGKGGSSPLGIAARQGNEKIIDLLLDRGATVGFPIIKAAILGDQVQIAEELIRIGSGYDRQDEAMGEILQLACLQGFKSLAQALIQNGANVNFSDWNRHGSVLQASAQQDNEEIVQMLIDNGAYINYASGTLGTALHVAINNGHENIVMLLINHGADVNIEGGNYCSTLQAASFYGYEDIVRLLVDHGADVNSKGGWHGSALQTASSFGYENIAVLLINHGAHVNSEGGEFATALQAASYSGHESIVRLLIDHGANIDSQGGEYGSALIAASKQGHDGIVQTLIAAGADVNIDGGSQFGTALQRASGKGHLQIVQKLLDAGADVDSDGGTDGTALHAAVMKGHWRVVDALLEANASANKAYPGRYKSPTPLYAAAKLGDRKLVERLLAHGADVDAWSVKYGTALIIASSKGHLEVAQLLLDAGADIDLYGRLDGSALYEASSNGHDVVVRKLLAKGANVNAGNPFLAALQDGHIGIAELLRGHGANIDAPSGHCSSALSWASREGKAKFVRTLLDYGADPNMARGKFPRPLQAAAAYGHDQIVEVLLDHGAHIDADESDEDQDSDEPEYDEAEEFLPQKSQFWDRYETEQGEKRRASALYKASKNGMLSTVQLLIKRGARVDARRGRFGSALHAALNGGHGQVAHELLDQGADPHLRGRVFDTALDAALSADVSSVVERLLKDSSRWSPMDLGNALRRALGRTNKEVVERLLDLGANVFTNGSDDSSMLYSVSAGDAPEALKIHFASLLIEKEVNVDEGGEHGSPLQMACYKQQKSFVEFLLNMGADPNVQGGKYGNALQAVGTARSSRMKIAVDIAMLLIEKGANVNARHCESGTALQAAALSGNRNLMQLLLQHGAEINTHTGLYGNPLQAAACCMNSKYIEYLVGKGADVNAQGGQYGTALQALVSSNGDNRQMVRFLLDQGSDVNANGGEYGNALQAACCNGWTSRSGAVTDIVNMIIDAGADVNSAGGLCGNALQAASFAGKGQLVSLLLARGANANARGGEYDTALRAAVIEGHKNIVLLLLNNGADVNAGSEESNAIQAAAEQGYEGIVRLLLEGGAVVHADGGAIKAAERKGYKRIVAMLRKEAKS
ncbi:unnamed protein product [Clonostachys solani]|uniref:Ankyrin repeat domain-containing protein 50 n=1 Tax=Clonostachys solani TaxID=160281 RepID=A0A9N9Z7C0_9HYPO|nr:unnamed protein product [Clonostachys solani]